MSSSRSTHRKNVALVDAIVLLKIIDHGVKKSDLIDVFNIGLRIRCFAAFIPILFIPIGINEKNILRPRFFFKLTCRSRYLFSTTSRTMKDKHKIPVVKCGWRLIKMEYSVMSIDE